MAMNMTNRTIALAMTVLGLLLSCGDSAPSPVSVAESFIRAVHHGDYTKAADLTLALDSAPASYRDLIAMRYREIGSEHRAQYGDIKNIVCKRSDISDSGADVYLTIEYSDKTTANVLVQLSKDGGEWKIR